MRFRSALTSPALIVCLLAVPLAARQQAPYRQADGITMPKVVREVKPEYPAAAKRERIQGTVVMDVVVLADGNVGDVTVTRSLDETYGLDAAAVSAVRQWQFEAGKKDGKAVPVQVEIEMSFSLK
jgi:periplasmic protein TonB